LASGFRVKIRSNVFSHRWNLKGQGKNMKIKGGCGEGKK
jgi:hypothetical protein